MLNAALLPKALNDAKIWCYHCGCGPRLNISDQHWISLFAGHRSVMAQDVADFIKTFQLDVQRYPWDADGVAEVINEFAKDTQPFLVAEGVYTLAVKLGKHLRTPEPTKQTSAASKFSFFARPAYEIFIWDKWVRKAAAHHCQVSLSTYKKFQSACSNLFREEAQSEQFRKDASAFVAWIDYSGGPMADRALVSEEFLHRRLFDKWMFHEGKSVG